MRSWDMRSTPPQTARQQARRQHGWLGEEAGLGQPDREQAPHRRRRCQEAPRSLSGSQSHGSTLHVLRLLCLTLHLFWGSHYGLDQLATNFCTLR